MEVEKKIKRLLLGGVKKSDIIIISRFRLTNSALSGTKKIAGLNVNDLTESRSPKKNSIDFCTVHGFKGLERRAVLAIDLQDLLNEESRYLHYCGLSRARSFLAVFINEDEKVSYDTLSKDFGKRLGKLI